MQSITPQLACTLTEQHWGITGVAQELPSYADRNFKIGSAAHKYVLKIANPNWSYDDLDFENAALLRLEKTCTDLALPKVIVAPNGQHIIEFITPTKQRCHLRLLSYVDGEVYANAAVRPHVDQRALQTSLGAALAKIDSGLVGFTHPRMNRFVDWSISNLPDMLGEIVSIDDLVLRDIVRRHADFFAAHEQHWKQTLPMSVIHNDANDFNVIVASGAESNNWQVNAMIDFGDMCFHLRIVDLAIAITYALQHIEDDHGVRSCMLAILSGYQANNPLTRAEIDILFHLMMGRLCQSILMATKAQRRDPNNAYIMVSQTGVRRLLRQLDAMNVSQLQYEFLRVL
jgi:Ser/Thr protein kinase RdoA (MazF antagonist)